MSVIKHYDVISPANTPELREQISRSFDSDQENPNDHAVLRLVVCQRGDELSSRRNIGPVDESVRLGIDQIQLDGDEIVVLGYTAIESVLLFSRLQRDPENTNDKLLLEVSF